MPPRYAYWTILVDEQPTAFRASSQEDLMPTFNRLKEKNATAKMMWWQHGKLWDSRVAAQEAMYARSETGRAKDFRQRETLSERRPGGSPGRRESKGRRESQDERAPRREPQTDPRDESGKLDWQPKGTFTPRPKAASTDRPERRPERRERSDRDDRPAWKPTARAPRAEKPEWKPKHESNDRPERRPERRERSDRAERPEWKPKGPPREERPEWRPKGEGLAPRDHLVRRSVRDGGKGGFKKPEWKGKGAGFGGGAKKDWSPKGEARSRPEKPEWRPKENKFATEGREPRRSAKPEGGLEWRPKGSSTDGATSRPPRADRDAREGGPPKRKWVPKEEYKKSLGIEAKRDKNWRPGGEHKDPRQKYKDAKKAKWGRFKQNIRQKWDAKQGAGKKKREE